MVGEEYFNLRAEGSRLIIRCSSTPVYDDKGEIAAAVLVLEDVTGQRRVDEQLASTLRASCGWT